MRISDWSSDVCSSDLSSMPGFKASLTYFDVDYRDRIGTLTEDYLRFLTNRDVFGGVVLDNPPLDLVQFYYSQPSFTNPIAIAPHQVVAILDGQTRNPAREHQNGIHTTGRPPSRK